MQAATVDGKTFLTPGRKLSVARRSKSLRLWRPSWRRPQHACAKITFQIFETAVTSKYRAIESQTLTKFQTFRMQLLLFIPSVSRFRTCKLGSLSSVRHKFHDMMRKFF
ncbi:hypothetical protein CEXT_454001 [Caerostris extrusa]|uniref:Uncharacterized protein n=1 Tax=Caerostris extrusa TaxID=172846 RepID=A0AAV4SDA4_CAEEX|nr:hypothetical protein CEXT_454001 [Caerostris extrusa]